MIDIVDLNERVSRLATRVGNIEALVAVPVRDPDGVTARRRLLEIRQWCDKHDPWGASAAGFVVRLMRSAIDARIYGERGGRADGWPVGDAGDLP